MAPHLLQLIRRIPILMSGMFTEFNILSLSNFGVNMALHNILVIA